MRTFAGSIDRPGSLLPSSLTNGKIPTVTTLDRREKETGTTEGDRAVSAFVQQFHVCWMIDSFLPWKHTQRKKTAVVLSANWNIYRLLFLYPDLFFLPADRKRRGNKNRVLSENDSSAVFTAAIKVQSRETRKPVSVCASSWYPRYFFSFLGGQIIGFNDGGKKLLLGWCRKWRENVAHRH